MDTLLEYSRELAALAQTGKTYSTGNDSIAFEQSRASCCEFRPIPLIFYGPAKLAIQHRKSTSEPWCL